MKTATIDHVVTDMGNGGAHCSACGYILNEYLNQRRDARLLGEKIDKESRCPGCKAIFIDSTMWISGLGYGGDF